jgi:hypothetical protein
MKNGQSITSWDQFWGEFIDAFSPPKGRQRLASAFFCFSIET